MRVHDMQLFEQPETGAGWELRAHEAAFYATQQLIVVQQVQAQLHAPEARAMQVVADHGRVDSATGDMTVQGHVQVRHLEGYTLATDVLHWHSAERILWTDGAVKIDSARVSMTGRGLQGNVEEQRFVVQADVRAAFLLR